nr:zinc finger, CCHC-type [Tanacetum cinerariifolium]
PIPPASIAPAGQHVAPEILAAHIAWIKGSKEIDGLMLMTMEPEIQQNMENLHAREMLLELKTLFAQQAEQKLLQTTRDFHSCKQEEGQLVSSYVLKMKGYIDNLEYLGHPVTLGLGVSLILIGLRKEYDGFMQNYNMHSMGKIVNELHAMLKLHEQTLPKNNALALHAIRAGKVQKVNKASRKLKLGSLSLYVGNGQCEAVNAIGFFYVCLPSGLDIVLNNFHYATSITRGVISISCLYEDSFINCFVNNTIQVSKNKMVYFSAIPRDGIFEIDLSTSYTNESSIYAIRNKIAKLDLDSALLWHCRLGHISKKRIEKLQHDGLINSTELIDFEMCVPLFQKEVENQLGKTIKLLRSDRGGEYMSQEFLDHLKDHSIIAHRTPLYTPQHNEVSERKNRTLLDMVEKIPYKVWHGQDLKLSYLKVWGCEALVKQDTLTKPDKSTRTGHALDCMCLYIDAEEHELRDLGEPANYKVALLDPKSDKWLNAMNVEMQSMKDNEVWVLVELPPDGKTVYKLKHSIYGLKQESRQWNKRFDDEIKKFGFTQNHDEPCVYLKDSRSNVTFLILYVDDVLIMGNSIPMLQDVKSYLGRCFAKKDLGEAAYILRIKIYKDRSRQLIELRVSCYTDAGYLTDADDLKSQTRYELVLNGGAVDWKSAKQSIFATSSAEAECIAAFDAAKEAVWVRKFISGLDVVPTIEEPISMYCDNTRAIAIANE